MSNFQPSISGSQIINPLPTLNNKPQVKVENTEHTSETQVHSKKSETQTQTPVKKVSEEPLPEPEVIKEKIDKTPSEQVLTLKQEIDSLKKTPLKLKHVDAPLDLSLERAKIEYLSNIQTDGQLPKNLNHVNKQQFQAIQSTQVSDRIIRKDKQGLDTLIQSHFAVFENKLRDRLVSTDKQTAAAKELAKTLISQKDPDNEILLKINGLNDQDLLDLVAKNIGALRSDRYGNQATFTDLSSKKQALVRAIAQGMRESADLRSLDTQMALESNAIRTMHDELRNVLPNSDTAFGWSLKGSLDIQAEYAIQLGWVTPQQVTTARQNAETFVGIHEIDEWKRVLNPFQVQTLEAISKGITHTLDQKLPNRVSASQDLQFVEDGIPQSKNVPSRFSLNGDEYENPVFLGKGGVGLILEYNKVGAPNEKVVVKSLLNPLQRADLCKEVIAHRHVLGGENMQPDDNIINLRGVVKGPNDGLFMVMDKADGGDLYKLSNLLSFANRQMGLPQIANSLLIQHYLKEAAQGLDTLQESGAMHNDIKGLNFLLHEGKVKLADLGSTHTQTVMTSAMNVPTTYAGSEWVVNDNNDANITQKNDMYALGVMLHMLNGGNPPPTGTLLQGDPNDHTALGNLKRGLLANDPNDRISPQGILNSGYIKNLEKVDGHQMKKLLEATENFGKIAGSRFMQLDNQIVNLLNSIDLASKALNGTPPGNQDRINRITQELNQFQNELNTARTQQRELFSQSPGKEAYQELLNISQMVESRIRV
jgi:serine/threonine protein kinase